LGHKKKNKPVKVLAKLKMNKLTNPKNEMIS